MTSDDSLEPGTFVVGDPDEWQAFATAHGRFVRCLQELVDTGQRIYGRTLVPRNPGDLAVFGLGLLCAEDFREIYTLAGNGLGFGMAKLFRGMFERVVTASYLQQHPAQAERFVKYEHIRRFKLALPLWTEYGEEFLTAAAFEALKNERDTVAPEFVQSCRTSGCDRTFPSGSWTDLDFVSMTRAAGEGLYQQLPAAYRLPMGETHASFSAVMARMTSTPTGSTFENSARVGRDFVPTILVQAHLALIHSYRVQLEQFPELKAVEGGAVDACETAFREVWSPSTAQ